MISTCSDRDEDCAARKCLYAGGECDPFYDIHAPVHSDFLVYWTGLDIDSRLDPSWEQNNDTKLNREIVTPYIDRLKNILEYGLWMTSSDSDAPLIHRGKPVEREPFSRTCFTELKLSQARTHAKRFGRLGIGVKRPFVMEKRGAPVIYYRDEYTNWFFNSFGGQAQGRVSIPGNAWWAYYLKSMDEGTKGSGFMQYVNFDESEWRVIFSESVRTLFGSIPGIESCSGSDTRFSDYLQRNRVPDSKRPQYLLPLDRWFAFIIYPSLAVKVKAEADRSVRDLIEHVKKTLPEGDDVKSSAQFEKYSKPFEINLSACAHF